MRNKYSGRINQFSIVTVINIGIVFMRLEKIFPTSPILELPNINLNVTKEITSGMAYKQATIRFLITKSLKEIEYFKINGRHKMT